MVIITHAGSTSPAVVGKDRPQWWCAGVESRPVPLTPRQCIAPPGSDAWPNNRSRVVTRRVTGKWWYHIPQERVFTGESNSPCRDFAHLEFSLIEVCTILSWKTLDSEPRGFGWTGRTTLVEGSSCNPLGRRNRPPKKKDRVLWCALAWSIHRQGLASDLALPVTLLESAFSQAIGLHC